MIKWQKKKRFVMNVVKSCGYVIKHFINGNIKASIIVAKLAMLKNKMSYGNIDRRTANRNK